MQWILSSVSQSLFFVREHGVIYTLRSKEAPWMIQFVKYGICGSIATVVQLTIFIALSSTVFPTSIDGITNAESAKNFVLSNFIGFLFANAVAYITNLMIVFHGGRHHRIKEFLIFTLISLIAFLPGIILGSIAILKGVKIPLAQLIFMVTSIMVNFVCRKFLVFAR